MGTAMKKKPMGRPPGDRDDVTVKFDRVLARRAKTVADNRRISRAEYLSELVRALVNRDYSATMKELESE